MRNFSLPDYDLVEIGNAVKRISQITGVPCRMHELPAMEAEGYVSLTAISDSIVKIGQKYGIASEPAYNIIPLGRQLQSMIDALVARGVVKYQDF